jgi:hypothetical protein
MSDDTGAMQCHYMLHHHVGSELLDNWNAKENHRGTCGQHFKEILLRVVTFDEGNGQ